MLLSHIRKKQLLSGCFPFFSANPLMMKPQWFRRIYSYARFNHCCSSYLQRSEHQLTFKTLRNNLRSSCRQLMTPQEDREELVQNTMHALHITMLFCGFAVFAMYYIMWYFKQRNFEKTVETLPPPIDWEDFVNRFVAKDLVKELNYRPDFCVVDVYLRMPEDEIKKKRKADKRISIIPVPEHALKPDLRFWFGGSENELKKEVENALLDAGLTGDIVLYVDSFPDKIEIAYMVMCLIFCSFFLLSSLKNRKTSKFFRRPP